jgi:hypothetical protein
MQLHWNRTFFLEEPKVRYLFVKSETYVSARQAMVVV